MAQTQPGAAAADVPGKARREVLIVLPGLLLAIMLAMLDQLVVGTALPRIVGDLGGVTHLSWVVTAYVLASTVVTPLYGKLGDMYGRKRLLVTGIVIFLIGSALSGWAHSMDQLIAFRALQGLGAGGLLTGAIATIGDMVPPRERGQYMGYTMGVMTLAMIGGPLLGGYITDNLSWRWIFYINMPVGGAALIYLFATMHLPRRRVEHRVDYAGAAVLAVASTAIILVTTWGGSQYAWGSAQIIGLGALAVAAVAVFLRIESRAAEPILPLHIFRNRNFSLASAMSVLLGLAMLGAMTFLPLYQQVMAIGKRTTAARTGIDRDKSYSIAEAVKLVKERAKAKFDETIEIAMNLGVDPKHADQMVRGVVLLPNGSGRTVRVGVFARGTKAEEAKAAGADVVGAEDLVEKVNGGAIDFDRCIATPDMMPLVGRLGKVLGPRGMMPNPKVGTVTMDITNAVKASKGGSVEFRVEKAGIVQAGVGKASFTEDKLVENIKAFADAVQKAKPPGAKGHYINRVAISSTMGPGVKVEPSTLFS